MSKPDALKTGEFKGLPEPPQAAEPPPSDTTPLAESPSVAPRSLPPFPTLESEGMPPVAPLPDEAPTRLDLPSSPPESSSEDLVHDLMSSFTLPHNWLMEPETATIETLWSALILLGQCDDMLRRQAALVLLQLNPPSEATIDLLPRGFDDPREFLTSFAMAALLNDTLSTTFEYAELLTTATIDQLDDDQIRLAVATLARHMLSHPSPGMEASRLNLAVIALRTRLLQWLQALTDEELTDESLESRLEELLSPTAPTINLIQQRMKGSAVGWSLQELIDALWEGEPKPEPPPAPEPPRPSKPVAARGGFMMEIEYEEYGYGGYDGDFAFDDVEWTEEPTGELPVLAADEDRAPVVVEQNLGGLLLGDEEFPDVVEAERPIVESSFDLDDMLVEEVEGIDEFEEFDEFGEFEELLEADGRLQREYLEEAKSGAIYRGEDEGEATETLFGADESLQQAPTPVLRGELPEISRSTAAPTIDRIGPLTEEEKRDTAPAKAKKKKAERKLGRAAPQKKRLDEDEDIDVTRRRSAGRPSAPPAPPAPAPEPAPAPAPMPTPESKPATTAVPVPQRSPAPPPMGAPGAPPPPAQPAMPPPAPRAPAPPPPAAPMAPPEPTPEIPSPKLDAAQPEMPEPDLAGSIAPPGGAFGAPADQQPPITEEEATLQLGASQEKDKEQQSLTEAGGGGSWQEIQQALEQAREQAEAKAKEEAEDLRRATTGERMPPAPEYPSSEVWGGEADLARQAPPAPSGAPQADYELAPKRKTGAGIGTVFKWLLLAPLALVAAPFYGLYWLGKKTWEGFTWLFAKGRRKLEDRAEERGVKVFELMLSEEATKPGPIERSIAQSKAVMRRLQVAFGLKIVVWLCTIDAVLEMITEYAHKVLKTWQSLKAKGKKFLRQRNRTLHQSQADDVMQARLQLARLLGLPGFVPEKNITAIENPELQMKLNDPTFPLELALTLRGLLDELKRDVATLPKVKLDIMKTVQESVKASLLSTLVPLIPNPFAFLRSWKDLIIMSIYMRYSRKDVEVLYARFLDHYQTTIKMSLEAAAEAEKEAGVELPPETVSPEHLALFDFEQKLLERVEHPRDLLLNDPEMDVKLASEMTKYSLQRLVQALCFPHRIVNLKHRSKVELLQEFQHADQLHQVHPRIALAVEEWLTDRLRARFGELVETLDESYTHLSTGHATTDHDTIPDARYNEAALQLQEAKWLRKRKQILRKIEDNIGPWS